MSLRFICVFFFKDKVDYFLSSRVDVNDECGSIINLSLHCTKISFVWMPGTLSIRAACKYSSIKYKLRSKVKLLIESVLESVLRLFSNLSFVSLILETGDLYWHQNKARSESAPRLVFCYNSKYCYSLSISLSRDSVFSVQVTLVDGRV